MIFASLEQARVALLCDAVRLASSSGESFAVIGGWSPFLLNSTPIKHPGTADVDLLFAEGVTAGQLKVQSINCKAGVVSSFRDIQLAPELTPARLSKIKRKCDVSSNLFHGKMLQ